MPKRPGIKTKKTLGKLLGKIDFSNLDIDDDVLLDASLELLSPLKNLVSVSVRKSFALNISSDKAVIVKKIPVETLTKTVHTVLSEFGLIKSIKMQLIGLWQKAVVEFEQSDHADLVTAEWSILIEKNAMHIVRANSDKELWDARDYHRALLYTLPMGTNVHNIWDFVRSVGKKTCVINHHSVTYVRIRCAVVCFDFIELLDAAKKTTLVLRDINLYWSSLMSTKCAKYEKTDYISLSCTENEKIFSGSLLCRVLSDASKSRLAAIYVKQSVPIKPFLPVVTEINDRFAALEHSLVSFEKHVNMLAKKLDALGPMNQEANIVMSESLGVVTGGETVARVVIFDSFVIEKMEDTLKNLAITVIDLLAKMDNTNKLSVTVLGLYAGASSETRFGQTLKINSVIVEAVNSSTFVVLGEDFNENRSDADEFLGAKTHSNVNAMWAVLERVVVESANKTFSRHWFSEFYCSRNKFFSKFFGLKLLIAKIVKKFGLGDLSRVNCLMRTWLTLDSIKACAFIDLVDLDEKSEVVLGYLSLIHKEYRRSKMYESRLVEEVSIRLVVSKHIENFYFDKGSMIKSILDWLFCKVVLNHLVVDDKLILEPKKAVSLVVPDLWAHQYALLDYVQNCAFSSVMGAVGLSELLLVVNNLPNGKAAGLSSISNKLWKHGNDRVLGYFLRLLNTCLLVGSVPVLWRRAWVSIIPKFYDWDRVLTNTQPIALIETAKKILSKIFLIGSLLYTASLVFFVDMHKAYDSVSWLYLDTSLHRIKMCNKFIRFFGSIHGNRINRIMTDFSLTNEYRVCNSLDQGKRIFYNSFLCKVKRHEHLCSYQIDTKFVARTGKIETSSRLSSFFAAGVFVDDTIWVGNCQVSMQYALNIASEFFAINNISIKNEKTVAIPINQGIKMASLNINGQPISIARKSKTHRYLGIFLSTEGLSKPSVAKAHSDVHFFVNVVLKKVITDKQFSYLVSAVLQPIVSYRIQFNFVSLKVCHKWDAMQLQSKCKLAAVVSFSNASGILRYLFNHRFLDLQILGWALLNSLQFPIKLCISSVNNFLAGVVRIFLDNKLSLTNNLPSAFYSLGAFPISSVLRNAFYFSSIHSLKHFGITFGNRLFDKKEKIEFKRPCFFLVCDCFKVFDGDKLFIGYVLNSMEFSNIQSGLHKIWSGLFDIVTHKKKTDIKKHESLFIIQKTPQPNLQISTPEYQPTPITSSKSGRIRINRSKPFRIHKILILTLLHISAELAFNFYINKRIVYLLGTSVNTESARETFYNKLIQNTSLSTNHNFASIITEINKEIEYYTQQRYLITYVSKRKGKLQTPAKKTRVESPTNSLYHYTPRSAINITSTDVFTSTITLTFGQFPFQNFETEEEFEDQEFIYQNPITENPEIETPNFQTQHNQNDRNPNINNQQHLPPRIVINTLPVPPIDKQQQQQLLQPPQ
ncbi:hypothetical protein G9A89_004760 [Geosiphon pyriformis]|nr:hypothetical protein G9A89_004760 [Geosiphon pyriformis]